MTRGRDWFRAFVISWLALWPSLSLAAEHYAVIDPKLLKLAQGCDLLIYDSQYTPEEYTGEQGGMPKLGWGHSTFVEAVKLAKAASVKQLVLYHHDPGQDDAAVREKERRAREIFPNSQAAYEGLSIRVG